MQPQNRVGAVEGTLIRTCHRVGCRGSEPGFWREEVIEAAELACNAGGDRLSREVLPCRPSSSGPDADSDPSKVSDERRRVSTPVEANLTTQQDYFPFKLSKL
jgi:hypothetical protein